MPLAEIRGIQICFERGGQGPPVLLISGTGGDLRHKPSVFSGALPEHFELLAYDQRGLGRSGKPDGPYTMADYADDAAALLDHVGWTQCSVVGISFGGMVAQELALRHPDRVGRLVLVCTSSGGEGGASYPLHDLEKLTPEQRALRSLEISDLRYDAQWRRENPEPLKKILETMARRRLPDADHPEALQGAEQQLVARRSHDTWSRLPEIRCPTLVCGGRYDGIAPPANQHALADRIQGAALQFFEGGHLFLLQDAKAWPAIIRFLGPGEEESD